MMGTIKTQANYTKSVGMSQHRFVKYTLKTSSGTSKCQSVRYNFENIEINI